MCQRTLMSIVLPMSGVSSCHKLPKVCMISSCAGQPHWNSWFTLLAALFSFGRIFFGHERGFFAIVFIPANAAEARHINLQCTCAPALGDALTATKWPRNVQPHIKQAAAIAGLALNPDRQTDAAFLCTICQTTFVYCFLQAHTHRRCCLALLHFIC